MKKRLYELNRAEFTDCKYLKNIDGLKYCENLIRVDLRFCERVHDLDDLEGLAWLQRVDLVGTDVDDISALSK